MPGANRLHKLRWGKQLIFVMAVNNSVELEAYVLFMIEPRLIETDVASIEKSLFWLSNVGPYYRSLYIIFRLLSATNVKYSSRFVILFDGAVIGK